MTMDQIPLSRGLIALIDEDDFERINQYKWCAVACNNGRLNYAKRNVYIGSKRVKQESMSRYIMGITDPKIQVDHINHNTLDNRKSNLRVCNNRQNKQNISPIRKRTSKFPGVHLNKQTGKWFAQIRVGDHRKYLGRFENERDAAKAYEKAIRELTGTELICKMGCDKL